MRPAAIGRTGSAMKTGDLVWRGAGLALIGLGCAPGLIDAARPTGSGNATIACLGAILATVGLILAINGRRVGVILRIERSKHRELPLLVRQSRRSRSVDWRR
jgi:hypothetical protein